MLLSDFFLLRSDYFPADCVNSHSEIVLPHIPGCKASLLANSIRRGNQWLLVFAIIGVSRDIPRLLCECIQRGILKAFTAHKHPFIHILCKIICRSWRGKAPHILQGPQGSLVGSVFKPDGFVWKMCSTSYCFLMEYCFRAKTFGFTSQHARTMWAMA